jgi:hypothetical protein
LALLAGAIPACGGDGDAVPTTVSSTTAPAVTASTSTTAPPTTTTTTPPTTTTQATTTTESDLHPAWGISWSALWQAVEGRAATYRTQIMGSEAMELQARFEFGVDWQDGTWDRLVIGTVEPGQWGAALYFSRPAPWVLRLWGVATTSAERDDMILEYFAEPPELDFALLPDEPPTIEGALMVEHGFGSFGPAPATFRVEVVGSEDVTVPAGVITGAYHLRFGLAGEFYGTDIDIAFFSDLWLHPDQLVVKWDTGPAGGPIELSAPWAPAG